MNAISTPVLSSSHMLPVKNASECENEVNRKWEAGFLFQQYGIKIPYRLDSGEYVIFEPTASEYEKYNKRLQQRKEMIDLELELNRKSISSSKVAMIHGICFFILFMATMLYEKRKINCNINS